VRPCTERMPYEYVNTADGFPCAVMIRASQEVQRGQGPLPSLEAPRSKISRYMNQNKVLKSETKFKFLFDKCLAFFSANALINGHILNMLFNRCFTSLLLCNCTN
jgi:hypothetical protein